MVLVVFPSVVLPEEDLDAAPRGLNGICVVPAVRIDEVDAVVDSELRETLRVNIAVRIPAVTDDRSTWFDPGIYDGSQCVGGSLRYGNKKCSARPSFNTAKHPPTLKRVSPILLSPTEHARVNLHCLVRTTDLFRATLYEHQHGFPEEHVRVSDST